MMIKKTSQLTKSQRKLKDLNLKLMQLQSKAVEAKARQQFKKVLSRSKFTNMLYQLKNKLTLLEAKQAWIR